MGRIRVSLGLGNVALCSGQARRRRVMKYLKSRWVWQLRYALTMLAVTATILLGSLPSSLAAPSPQHQLVAEAHSMKPPVANLTASDETNGSGPSFIRLQYATFDPLKGEPNIPTNLRASSQEGAGYRYYIVQLSGPVYESQKAQIQQAGGVIFDYIPDYAFIVRLDEQSRQVVSSLPFVRWVGYYHPIYKLSSPLRTLLEGGIGMNAPHRYVVLTFNQAGADMVVNKLNKQVISRSNIGPNPTVIANLDAVQAANLAQLEDVYYIEQEYDLVAHDEKARAITGVNLVWQDLGFFGAGQNIAVADSGFDTGIFGSYHTDFGNRLAFAEVFRFINDWRDYHGHGTAVAGVALGNGTQSGGGPNSFAGVAPQASLIVQSYLNQNANYGGRMGPVTTLFQHAYDANARVHNDSWGDATAPGQYVVDARLADDFMWNKLRAPNGEMVIVYSAGNEGADYNQDGTVDLGSVVAPATAKNVIAVGASENDRPNGQGWLGTSNTTYGQFYTNEGDPNRFARDPIMNDYPSNNIGGLAAFSGRGPTHDQRIKPDLVAPGTNLITTRPQGISDADLTLNGFGVIPGNSNYMYASGTSFSAPLVSGAVALVRENFSRTFAYPNPSAALVKATLLNSATDLAPGQYLNGSEISTPRPNNVEGWGRLNVKQAIAPTAPLRFAFRDSSAIGTNQSRLYKYAVADVTVPLHITLAWSDAPANLGSAVDLVNDLNLKIEAPDGTIYWGNGVQGGDHRNNVETVDVANPLIGEYKVRVSAESVAVGGNQPFALAVLGGLGCTDAANTALQRPTAPASCWQQGSTPETEETNILRGVAPITSNDAWAVGSKETFDFSELTPQLLHWNGTAWAVADQPACVTQPLVAAKLASGRRVDDERGDVGKSFNAVAAVSSSDVWAVGQCHYFANDQEVQRTLTMHYDGTGWTKVPAPDANPHFNTLEGLTAVPDSNQIWAVGYARPNEQSPDQPLTMRWDGSGWNTVTAPGSAGEQKLYAVAASTITDVWAVGSSGSDPNTTALLLHNDGSGWANISLNLTSSLTQTLYAVTAIAPNDAWAVGADSNGVLMLHWDGSNWTRTPYSTSLVGNLYSVAALDSRDVWAVGEDTSGQYPAALTLHWDGVTWRQVDAPRPGFQQTLYSVGVNSSEGEVWAVGDSHETYPVAHNLTLYKHYTAATLQSKGGR